jgi:hypothetical protein
MNVKQQLRKIADLGITDFESLDDAKRLQNDFLEGLKSIELEDSRYTAFLNCRPAKCGRKTCSDACAFGARRRRLQEILAAHRLLNASGPICEVRFTRGAWERQTCDLWRLNMATMKKLNNRALDNLNNLNVVAVGAIKVAVQHGEPRWAVQVHEIVAGSCKADLVKTFGNRASIKELTARDLAGAISNVLRRDLARWQHPFDQNPSGPEPKSKTRAEFYEWTLRIATGARVIRYGCDRYFNKLKKKPRTVRVRERKGRPYPHWLKEHMFGYGKWKDVDPHSSTYRKKNKNIRIGDPGPGYYDAD